jgi:DNA-binding SARP family transcriptional activator
MMRFRLLGPVEVRVGEDWRGIGAPKWRSVLAALLIHPGQIVSADTLISEVWRDDPPARAANLISIYVLRLRRLMDDPDGRLLVTRTPGYQLRVTGDDTDALLFEAMVRDGRRAFAAGGPAGGGQPADRGPRPVVRPSAGRHPADAAGRGGGRTACRTPPRRRRTADHGRTHPRRA